MTKSQLQKELKEKVKEGVKPSDLKKLKRSKSADDIPKPSLLPTSIPLSKSKSQLEIPLQPSSKQQISQLQEQVQFHAETAANYLKSLQSSQAKVSELEEKLKSNPPNVLLTEQLKEKQKELESLREKLEKKNEELKTLKAEHSTLLDDNLTLKHQSLKDWWQQYEKTKELDEELEKNVNYASNELIEQDKVIERLRSENFKLQKTNQSLQKDLNLTQKLIDLRKKPLPNPDPNSYYSQLMVYAFLALWFITLLNSSWPSHKDH